MTLSNKINQIDSVLQVKIHLDDLARPSRKVIYRGHDNQLFEFIQEQPPSDSKLVEPSLTRITDNYGQPDSYTGDRGFDSPQRQNCAQIQPKSCFHK